MVRLITILAISFALIGCEVEHDSLTLTREDFQGNQLRLNGYYYHEGMGDSVFWDHFILYRNGVILSCGTNPPLRLENYFDDAHFINKLKINRTCWGIFQISGDSIQFEKWYHGGGAAKLVYARKGIILNDSTFVMTVSSKSNGDHHSTINELYHFRKFSPKPDSTNQFIP
jgi:hypothetical protein